MWLLHSERQKEYGVPCQLFGSHTTCVSALSNLHQLQLLLQIVMNCCVALILFSMQFASSSLSGQPDHSLQVMRLIDITTQACFSTIVIRRNLL